MAWVTLPAEGRPGPPPELPAPFDERGWSDGTRTWWATIWATPAAARWRPPEVGLHRLAILHEHLERGDATAAMHGEIRAVEDRFGLNPKALLALRWRVEEPDAGGPAVVVPAARRKRLKVVEP